MHACACIVACEPHVSAYLTMDLMWLHLQPSAPYHCISNHEAHDFAFPDCEAHAFAPVVQKCIFVHASISEPCC